MPTVLISSDQRAASDLRKATNSSGVPVPGVTSASSKRPRTSADCTAATISLLSTDNTGFGVPAGANIPYQPPTRKSATPDSSNVGTSGTVEALFADEIATPRNRPAVTSGIAAATGEKIH